MEPHAPTHRPTATRTAIVGGLILAIACSTACFQGSIYLPEGEGPRLRLPPSGLEARFEPLPRMESDKYQAAFESRLLATLEGSGLFDAVRLDAGAPVDLVLNVERATVAFDRRVHPAYFPLAMLTLTLYIWVGGPMVVDSEFYDLRLRAHSPEGRFLFESHVRDHDRHGLSLYSREHRGGQGLCQGPYADAVIDELVTDLGRRIRSVELTARADR